jgi:TDG/mug DNA glycosylase family protein
MAQPDFCPWKPTRAQVEAARGSTVPDVIARGLRVLFVGINPGLYSGAVGHHFARPGNRFWPALREGGFTDRVLSPFRERELLDLQVGITNIVAHATATADQLTIEDLTAGARRLERKVRRFRPRFVAFLGVQAYRTAFSQKQATIGPQEDCIGESRIWVLPNPSGLNAHYQLRELGKLFAALRAAADQAE